jgi:uncharacterized protein (TIGR00266 family)
MRVAVDRRGPRVEKRVVTDPHRRAPGAAATDPEPNVVYPGGTIMDVDIRYSPSFALAVITLPPGGEVKAEAGAMTSMSGGVEIETRAQGGLLKGLKRSVLGGESFFINTFRAPSGGELTVSPTLPGDIVHMPVDNSGALMVQSGSWLASDPDVQVDTKWGGGRTFFSGEGLFLLRCFGAGDMIVSSYGAIERRTLAPDQVLKIDTGHIVAFQEVTGQVPVTGSAITPRRASRAGLR